MPFLPEHQTAKAALLANLRSLAELAEKAGLKTLRADLLDTRIPKIEDERFHLVVLGEFNHGKSTFVNALLGAEVLPTGITPTTAAINHVVWADQPRARAVLVAGGEAKLDPKKLQEWVTVEGKHAAEVKYVEVGYPASILEDKSRWSHPRGERHQRAARRDHLRVRAARRRRESSLSTPGRRSRSPSARFWPRACSSAPRTGDLRHRQDRSADPQELEDVQE